jgi:hypothetical protein
MATRSQLGIVALGVAMLLSHTSVLGRQSPVAPVSSAGDPAVDAFATFVAGKRLDVPVDREFVVAALDRLVSALEALALRTAAPDEQVLFTAHRLRREIRRLQPIAGDKPSQIKERWDVFMAVAQLAADVSRHIGPRGAGEDAITSLLRSADGLDYDYPLRWQPGNIGNYFDLASRVLAQMTRSRMGRRIDAFGPENARQSPIHVI